MTTQAAVCRSQRPVAVSCSTASVLVIDDDPEFRDLALTILSSAGFRVTTAGSVAAGLKQLRAHPTDLLVLDIIMPDRDGIDALGDIRTLFPATRIVTVSGAGDSELYLKVSAYLGADASLEKSRIASLCALLRVVLDR